MNDILFYEVTWFTVIYIVYSLLSTLSWFSEISACVVFVAYRSIGYLETTRNTRQFDWMKHLQHMAMTAGYVPSLVPCAGVTYLLSRI